MGKRCDCFINGSKNCLAKNHNCICYVPNIPYKCRADEHFCIDCFIKYKKFVKHPILIVDCLLNDLD